MPQNGPTVQSVAADPKFQALPPEAQVKVLSQIDPNFAALPSEAQQTVMKRLGTPQQQDLTQQMQSIPTGDVLKQAGREALPYAGAAGASMLLGPEAGVLARMGAAAVGGAGGSVASHVIPASPSMPGGTQPPLFSGAGAIDVAEDAAKQAAIELGSSLIGKGIGALIGRFTSKVPVEEAAAKIADSIHPEITPAEFGEKLRSTLDTTRTTLGQQKGQVLDDIASKFQPTQPTLKSTLSTLRSSISDLENEKKLSPSLFQTGQPKGRTLGVLNDLLDSIQNGNFAQPGKSVIRSLDDLRSSLFQLGKGMDRSLPKNIVGQLTHAVHDDIGATLGEFGPDGDAAFLKFENASSAFRQAADALDQSTFKRILKANINQPEKVINILMQAPESNIEDLQGLLKNSPNGKDVLDSVKHLALERAASNPNGLEYIPEPARQVVFGSDLPKIEQFFNTVESAKPGASMLSRAAVHGAGMAGGGVASTVAGWIVRSGSETASISSTQLAALLGSKPGLLMRAANTAADSRTSALIMRALGAYIQYPEPQGNPTPFQQPLAATPNGATIGDQLKSKGISLPTAQPSGAGSPFHPGAGLQ
jgi:hypothetical protein